MNQQDAAAAITDLHDTYCRAVGFGLRLNQARVMAWMRYLHAGFTKANLATVAAYLRREIAQGKRNDGALKFSNMIDFDNGFERFEEDLALAEKSLNMRPRPAMQRKSITAGSTTAMVDHDPAADPEAGSPISDFLKEYQRGR